MYENGKKYSPCSCRQYSRKNTVLRCSLLPMYTNVRRTGAIDNYLLPPPCVPSLCATCCTCENLFLYVLFAFLRQKSRKQAEVCLTWQNPRVRQQLKKIISRKACCLFFPRGENFLKIELDTLERAQGEEREKNGGSPPFLFFPRNPQTFSPLEVKREKEEGDPGDGFVPGDLLHHPLLLSLSHPLFPSFCFLPKHVRGS